MSKGPAEEGPDQDAWYQSRQKRGPHIPQLPVRIGAGAKLRVRKGRTGIPVRGGSRDTGNSNGTAFLFPLRRRRVQQGMLIARLFCVGIHVAEIPGELVCRRDADLLEHATVGLFDDGR